MKLANVYRDYSGDRTTAVKVPNGSRFQSKTHLKAALLVRRSSGEWNGCQVQRRRRRSRKLRYISVPESRH